MEIKIGIQQAAREVVLESGESAEQVGSQVEAALAGGVLSLVDVKGRRVLVPGDKIAYVEIGGGVAGQVGFRH